MFGAVFQAWVAAEVACAVLTVRGQAPGSMIHHGDCLEVMAGMEPESVDAVVTDPPYNLVSGNARYDLALTGAGNPRERRPKGPNGGFMGKAWDGTGIAFRAETWAAAFRVAKPSSYLLAFGGTRTVHRMAVAIEDAGWIIRDMLVWAYASGFPKSKASLKPAWEPIVMARKPGPLRMLAVDACRIPTDEDFYDGQYERQSRLTQPGGGATTAVQGVRAAPLGRWPANVLLTDAIFDGDVDGVVGGGADVPSGGRPGGSGSVPKFSGTYHPYQDDPQMRREFPADSGTYSRFFLIPKADRSDREPRILVTDPDERQPNLLSDGGATTPGLSVRRNQHPTVKPTELMRHLVRLVTPAGGTVLDPFLGSGTTGIACELEGFPWIGIEKEAEYVAIAEARLNGTQRGMGLSA